MRFIVLIPGRTGSTYLISCLRSNPSVVAEEERLCDQPFDVQREFLHGLYDRTYPRSVKAVGFKTKLKDVRDLAWFAEFLRERDIGVIELRRRNAVKLAVSVLNARKLQAKTGQWNRYPGVPAPGVLTADPAELGAVLEEFDGVQDAVGRYAAQLELRTLRIYYEDLLKDRKAWLETVAGFLRIKRLEPAEVIEKATNDDLRVALGNYDEVRAYFEGTRHAGDFE